MHPTLIRFFEATEVCFWGDTQRVKRRKKRYDLFLTKLNCSTRPISVRLIQNPELPMVGMALMENRFCLPRWRDFGYQPCTLKANAPEYS